MSTSLLTKVGFRPTHQPTSEPAISKWNSTTVHYVLSEKSDGRSQATNSQRIQVRNGLRSRKAIQKMQIILSLQRRRLNIQVILVLSDPKPFVTKGTFDAV